LRGRSLSKIAVMFAAVAVVLVIGALFLAARREEPPTVASVPVRFESRPAGAAIRVGDRQFGETPQTVQIAPGAHVVRLSIPGYAPVEQSISVASGVDCCSVVELAALPAVFRVWTDMPSSLSLDEGPKTELVPGEPLELRESMAGEHRVQVDAAAGRTALVFRTTPAALPEIDPPSAPRGLRVLLFASFGPSGRIYSSSPVKISADGKTFSEAGPGGVDIPGSSGKDLELTVDDGSGTSRTLQVKGDWAPSVEAFVLSGKALDFGSILIRANETNLTVLIDGHPRTLVPRKDALLIPNVETGKRKIEVQKPGFRVALDSETVEVRGGRSSEVKASLTPIPVSYVVRGAIRGTQVQLGNQVKTASTAEVAFEDVPPGLYDVRLTRRGYRETTFKIRIEPGRPTELGPPHSVLERFEGTVLFKVETPGTTMRIEPTADVVDYTGPHELKEIPRQLSLPAGTYNLTFSAPGFAPDPITLQLVDQETKTISVRLVKR
jgi:hypothetical protein